MDSLPREKWKLSKAWILLLCVRPPIKDTTRVVPFYMVRRQLSPKGTSCGICTLASPANMQYTIEKQLKYFSRKCVYYEKRCVWLMLVLVTACIL